MGLRRNTGSCRRPPLGGLKMGGSASLSCGWSHPALRQWTVSRTHCFHPLPIPFEIVLRQSTLRLAAALQCSSLCGLPQDGTGWFGTTPASFTARSRCSHDPSLMLVSPVPPPDPPRSPPVTHDTSQAAATPRCLLMALMSSLVSRLSRPP